MLSVSDFTFSKNFYMEMSQSVNVGVNMLQEVGGEEAQGDVVVRDAVRGEVRLRRIKCYYFETNYKYEFAVTPETIDVMRRCMSWAIVYMWRHALFAVQYDGMTEDAVLQALRLRAAGRKGGMPEGAVISEEEAWERLQNGETAYMRGTFGGVEWDLSREPLMVQIQSTAHGDVITTVEITAAQAGAVYRELGVELGVMPFASGINSGRRNMAVATSQGLDKEGWGQMLVKKAMAHQSKQGTNTFEAQYDSSPHNVDMAALQMGRKPEQIEGLRSLTTTRVPWLVKYRKFGDVDKNDPILVRLLNRDVRLHTLAKAMYGQSCLVTELEKQVSAAGGDGAGGEELRKVKDKLARLTKASKNLTLRLQHQVIVEKR